MTKISRPLILSVSFAKWIVWKVPMISILTSGTSSTNFWASFSSSNISSSFIWYSTSISDSDCSLGNLYNSSIIFFWNVSLRILMAFSSRIGFAPCIYFTAQYFPPTSARIDMSKGSHNSISLIVKAWTYLSASGQGL